jgi:hypothetical protein
METMTDQTHASWTRDNQQYLMAAIAGVRAQINAYAAALRDEAPPALGEPFLYVFDEMNAPPALDELCRIFQLSSFERAILLVCAGMELDAKFAHCCALAQMEQRSHPTFELLLAALNDAHWDATSPAAALRKWRLIEMGSGATLMSSPLRIDERILHYLTGTSYLDQRLEGLVEPVSVFDALPASQLAVAQRAAKLWSARAEDERPVLIELCGADQQTRQAVAVNLCEAAGVCALRIFAGGLPLQHTEIHALARLVAREALLTGSAILLDCTGSEAQESARVNVIHLFAENLNVPLIVTAPQRIGGYLRQAAFLETAKPLMEEQRGAWRANLGNAAEKMNGHMDALLAQFNLSSEQIRASSLQAASLLGAAQEGASPEQTLEAVWESCRAQARPGLDGLAQRVETNAGWDALVLPEPQLEMLHEIATQMRHRSRVYNAWGFGGASGRGLGITTLFAGASGTGKTTAAEVLAHELKLDLYRIDLSQVVSKYIGETEKSLRRIFDAAEEGGALLFFDEADALFGRRTEVKDSHDRYANIEVSYLLQRMEQYRGLAVLATNMKQALDTAFLRRIRFVVHFPFPDAALREQIWRRAIPKQAPTEAVDVKQLARLSVTGGNIRNIALSAAFLAVEAGEPIRMNHLLEAARGEYLKIEKPLTEPEIRGWV